MIQITHSATLEKILFTQIYLDTGQQIPIVNKNSSSIILELEFLKKINKPINSARIKLSYSFSIKC